MKKLLFTALGLFCLGLTEEATADSTAATAVSDSLFFFNTGEKGGLEVASKAAGEKAFTHVGQMFKSDYSAWGREKRMYAPAIVKTPAGLYVSVFQVNDYAPCFAVCVSADLTFWRPQDYPKMSVKGCLSPVVELKGGKQAVLFKTKDGQVRRTEADADFRHFSPDRPATAADYEAALGKASTEKIGDDTRNGCKMACDAGLTKALKAYHEIQKANAAKWREKLGDDAEKFASLPAGPVEATLAVNGLKSKTISDKLIGVFFEDISYAADGGLYAEMVQNRDFEYSARDRREWTATTAWTAESGTLTVADDAPLTKDNSHYLVLAPGTKVANSGWDGMAIKKGAKYNFSMFALPIDGKGAKIKVSLVDKDGKTLATTTIKTKAKAGQWTKYKAQLISSATTAEARLTVAVESKGRTGADMVSLFPQDTFRGHENGLRRDLAEAIEALHPKFIRFPGGCMSHGQGLDNIYHWQHTVGKLEDRVPDFNIWGYHQTRGLGFFEYFQYCEDIGAEPLPVLAAGVPCQNSLADAEGYGGQQGGIPMADMPAYIDELCHMIEWANADPATSTWAKLRADAGHPAPFSLKYIGIGNEDIISTTFEERFEMICRALRERHPEITICGTVGPFHAPSSDYVEGWRFAKEIKDMVDMVDEHYYESVGWFLHNQSYYDNYDRSAPKVYLGEYACNAGGGKPLDAALVEAFHLCGIERNADIVAMTSYAPLLMNKRHRNWSPDMIYFDNTSIDLSPSYETQRLFSTFGGTSYIASRLLAGETVKDRIATSIVRDDKTGDTYLRVVNILPRELKLTLSTRDLPLSGKLTYEGFHGQPGSRTIEKDKGEIDIAADKPLTVSLPAYSFRVIKL